jgi:hypothetical protein
LLLYNHSAKKNIHTEYVVFGSHIFPADVERVGSSSGEDVPFFWQGLNFLQ